MLNTSKIKNDKLYNPSKVELVMQISTDPKLAPKKGDPVRLNLQKDSVYGVIASVIGNDLLIDIDGQISYWVFNKAETLTSKTISKHIYRPL